MTELKRSTIQEAIDEALEQVHKNQSLAVTEACWERLDALVKRLEASPLAAAAARHSESQEAVEYLDLRMLLLSAMMQLTHVAQILASQPPAGKDARADLDVHYH